MKAKEDDEVEEEDIPLRRMSLAALLLVMTACTIAHFTESRLGNDQYLVSVRSGSMTEPAYTQRALLFRCSEIALAEGYSWFAQLDVQNTPKQAVGLAGEPATMPRFSCTCKFFREKPSEGSYPNSYDAKAVHDQLAQEVKQRRSRT